MSGTSLDGVDIAHCSFQREGNNWKYSIDVAETISYSVEWRKRLSTLMNADALTYSRTHVEFGRHIGMLTKNFINRHQLKPDLISSHGHTIFHQPQNGLTAQIGDGSQIAAITDVDTVCDFRSKDIALGGQGAPLVPLGDELLFGDYDICINLGGIANISYKKNNQRIAYDICPVNIALNEIASIEGKIYDEDGKLAGAGKVNKELLMQLNKLDYYKLSFPKSLGREWIDKTFLPLIFHSEIASEDKARTVCEHIDKQISYAINDAATASNKYPLKILVSGGGAFNKYLVQLIHKSSSHEVILPDDKTIMFREALIFAFLGMLFVRNEINVLGSVTGASRNHISGALYKSG